MVVAWGSVVQTMNAKQHFEKQQDRYREARAALQRMVADIESAFMASLPHRQNILNKTFRHVAIGAVRVDGVLWVTVFFWG